MAGRGRNGANRNVQKMPATPAPWTLNEPEEIATQSQLSDLESTMMQLEGLLKEIEDVSSIIEFNTGAPAGASPSSERGLFRAAGGGAAVLAQVVAEELKAWHSKNEMHVVEYGAQHAETLRNSVQAKKQSQESRELVRQAVREHLFETASQVLTENVTAVNHAQNKLFKEKGVEVGNSIEAFGNLQKRLEASTSFLAHLQGDPPPQMVASHRAVHSAVQHKEQRAVGQRQRLKDLVPHLDGNLMTEADEAMQLRKANLQKQRELQMEALKILDDAQSDRQAANDLLEGKTKAAHSSTCAEPWKAIWPGGIGQDAASPSSTQRLFPNKVDEMGKPMMPQLGPAFEQAIVTTLTPQLLQQGSARIRDLRHEFYQSYLAKDSGERAKAVGNELERWQLKTKTELLKELLDVSQKTHHGIMKELRSSLDCNADDPTDQTHRTLASAETFHKQRAEFFDVQVNAADQAISSFCGESLDAIVSLRRRTELASLKRWNDVGTGLNLVLDESWMKCQWQLADEVRKALRECHKHVELPVENLDTERGRKEVELVSVAWKRCGTQTPQQLNFLETITKAISPTAESCAITKAALTLLEEELERVVNRLRQS